MSLVSGRFWLRPLLFRQLVGGLDESNASVPTNGITMPSMNKDIRHTECTWLFLGKKLDLRYAQAVWIMGKYQGVDEHRCKLDRLIVTLTATAGISSLFYHTSAHSEAMNMEYVINYDCGKLFTHRLYIVGLISKTMERDIYKIFRFYYT